MSDDFKLPGSSFQEVSKIIQGYALLGKASSLAEVSKTIGGMDPTNISRNTGFLVSVGILEPGSKKAPTVLGVSFGQALLHNQIDEVKRFASEIVSENDFLKGIISAIRIRKGMDDSGLRSHIAYSAGAKKGATTTAGCGTVIEFLQLSGAITAEDGKFVVATEAPRFSGKVTESSLSESIEGHSIHQEQVSGQVGYLKQPSVSAQLGNQMGVTININIDLSCGPDDLAEVGQKLRILINDLSSAGKDSEAETETGTAGTAG